MAPDRQATPTREAATTSSRSQWRRLGSSTEEPAGPKTAIAAARGIGWLPMR